MHTKLQRHRPVDLICIHSILRSNSMKLSVNVELKL